MTRIEVIYCGFICVVFGIIIGICIGHAQAKEDYGLCWRSMQDRPLAERINQCVPYLDKEWRNTKRGWKQ